MEQKCEYKTLHLSGNGYIVKCSQCENYQIAFGNVMFSITGYAYGEFKKAVSDTVVNCKPVKDTENERVKNITLQLYYSGVSLVLNYEELEVLQEMISQANAKEFVFSILGYSPN
jgi:hypothetical protein